MFIHLEFNRIIITVRRIGEGLFNPRIKYHLINMFLFIKGLESRIKCRLEIICIIEA